MTIANIRNTMQFSEEYSVGEYFTLRLYTTKRSGMYGYQYAAIIWDYRRTRNDSSSLSACSSKTTGCGYSKDGACVAEAFDNILGNFPEMDKRDKRTICSYAESGQIREAIIAYLGLEKDSHGQYPNLHYAHN